MKQTILVCDCCKDPRNPAVASLSLNDGRGTSPELLDICRDHLKGVRQYLASVRKSPTAQLKKDEIESLRKKIVQAVVANPGMKLRDIVRALNGAPKVGYHLRNLIADKTLKRMGNKSHSKYFPAK